jgi:PAS domain S-box-containing protein
VGIFGAQFRAAQLIFFSAAVACLAAIIFLASSVARDLGELRSAKRDTVQWTLSQVEIEFLDFALTLEMEIDSATPNLTELRKDFDVFYSRLAIVSEGRLFNDARVETKFGQATDEIRAFLTRNAEIMDSADDVLVSRLAELQADTAALRSSVRGLYIAGLGYFAEQSDELRNRLANTMLQLSASAGMLLILLAILTLYSRATNQQLRRQSHALVSANARMETILATSLDSVIVSDSLGHVIDFNAAAERTFGFKLAEIEGKLIRDLIVPDSLREAHQQGMERMQTTGEKRLVGHGHIQITAKHADGSEFPVELALESAQTADGEIIIAFLRDISERVRTEEELREARDLALAGEKAKSDFLAVMSHEIRTPLNGLLGNLTLLGDTRLSREQSQYQDNMEISGRQLMKHVNSVLDVARFESGKMPVRMTSFHVGELVQEVLDGQSGPAESNQTALSWRFVGASVDWIRSDRNHIEQILLNLVSNAIKFTKGGRVEIEVEAQGDMLDVRVIDSGVGIAEADQDRIFEDFESAGPATGGTGLGLGIATRLVNLLKGDIGVESSLGEGSVFWFSVPLQTVEAPEQTDLAGHQNAPLPGLRILLAEDNDMNAFVAKKMLEKEGHTVTWVQDGLLALEAVEHSVFDVILMDINMPKMDGLTATQRIRADIETARTTPILAFSANVLPEDKDRFLQNGMDGFIGKPIQMDELRSALETVTVGHVRPMMKGSSAAIPTNEARDLMGDNYDDFLARFLKEADALIDWIKAGDTPHGEVEHLCHKLVSTAAMFGAKDFQVALKASETAAKRGDDDMHLDALAATWKATRDKL